MELGPLPPTVSVPFCVIVPEELRFRFPVIESPGTVPAEFGNVSVRFRIVAGKIGK